MSTSKIIPKENAGQARRWQCPPVSGGQSGQAAVTGPVTAEAIEQIQKAAYQEAYDQGYDEGIKQGLARAQEQTEELTGLLKQSLTNLARPFEYLDREVEQQLVELAVSIARQIVRREIKTDPGQVIATVREAMLQLPVAGRKVYVYLHPEDLVLVKDKLSPSENDTYWQLLDDPTLNRGDCKVRTDSSFIDATVERKLASIVSNILGGERQEDVPMKVQKDERTSKRST